tara:strand:- start:15 stop:314 length:300 start_codon:yes stop_codon:yes gene_type:complete
VPVFDGETKEFLTSSHDGYNANGPILSDQRMMMEGVKFSVAADNDISILLSKVDPINPDDSWEIVLGGWEGTQSVIRKHGDIILSVQHTVGEFLNVRIF